MDLDVILAKTEKGKEELETRRSLSIDLRHALILVDGHSTLPELLKKGEGIPLLSDSLNILLRTGFIYSSSGNTAETSVSVSVKPETSQRPSSGNGSVKSQLIHLAINLLGKQSEKIIKKLKKLQTLKRLCFPQ